MGQRIYRSERQALRSWQHSPCQGLRRTRCERQTLVLAQEQRIIPGHSHCNSMDASLMSTP